eukprot:TRINITY_DN29498_c0_g1_i1.p1 TRINITY_DN29498_c0_g1~~TRINITY_DN29498_c0_g1_i1.p1  ORF type:complete len:700 (-),score=166.60 TRINITY_DN29498_c0_g1_i1:365-2464(-)
MLDNFSIFTRGGLVLWTSIHLSNLKGSPVDALIQTCLLQERSGEASFQHGKDAAAYTLKWTFHNELGLVFVAVYQRILQLLYVDELLALVKQEFTSGTFFRPGKYDYPEFGETYSRLLLESEERAKDARRQKQSAVVRDGKAGGLPNGSSAKQGLKGEGNRSQQNGKSSKQAKGRGGKGSGMSSTDEDSGEGEGEGNGNGSGNGTANGNNEKQANGELAKDGLGKDTSVSENGDSRSGGVPSAFDVSKLRKRGDKARSASATPLNPFAPVPRNGALRPHPNGKANGLATDSTTKPKVVKKNRTWDDDKPTKSSSKNGNDSGDDSTMKVLEEVEVVQALDVKKEEKSLVDQEVEIEDFDYELESDEEEGEAGTAGPGKKMANAAGAGGAPKRGGWLSSLFQSVAGKASLEKEDVAPALKVLKDRFLAKNVAEEIADKLCESVAARLVGKKQGSFTRLTPIVQAAMEEALQNILTPKRSVDVLREVMAAKEQGRPYVIVFVGVNGVGKSTNLAKVAYWLLQHDVKVSLAACDTFRAGAVEQLRTHARRLGVPLFERGYEKDPAAVARDAIREAFKERTEAVLVDTAGRMQDNEPLMRALAKLLHINSPDLTLFVGEALVGNDAVDQLSKFNQRLADLSTAQPPRCIDGILLTKYDTIDDKVGAALSMVYISSAPIMFVGCGQTYTDLKKLNVKEIIKALLK